VGVFVGTTMGESGVYEGATPAGGFDLAEGGSQVFATSVASTFGLTGPARTLGTACAAGNYAIGAAARAVASGRVDIALAGGVEPFSRIAMVGFARMRAMAPDGCAPFGLGRRGMTLGEGAAFVVLQRRSDAVAPRAVVGGLGLSADAHHPTAPREDGSGMAAAMRASLAASGLSPADIGWVSAHGTGTPRSDAAESLALHTVFGGEPPPVSSIKGALGHALGAATALEAVVAVRSLETGTLVPNAGVTQVDPSLDVDVVLTARDAPRLDWVLSCGYAFGGLNSALALGRAA
jgi:3-oxoacyl-[acyl-carrier-protein] synthase II